MVHRRDRRALQHTEAALGKVLLHAAAEHRRGGGVRTTVKEAAASPNWSASASSASGLIIFSLTPAGELHVLKRRKRTLRAHPTHDVANTTRGYSTFCRRCQDHPSSTTIHRRVGRGRMDRRTQAGRALEAGDVARTDVACRACPASQTPLNPNRVSTQP